jgi:RNA polymerase sigma factor (sigma-70 family)
MTENSLMALRRFLIDRYDEIKGRLTRRLGSPELAGDALQDAWVKIARVDTLGEIRNPRGYILSIAMNAARDRMHDDDRRYLASAEIDGLLDVPDEAPDPARVAEARSELRNLESILQELPKRRRDILLAARIDKLPRQEIARRFGISQRLVEKELQRAAEYCLTRRGEGARK